VAPIYLAMLLLLKGMKSLTGSAEAGRALTAEVSPVVV
jgi:hypothetical protein